MTHSLKLKILFLAILSFKVHKLTYEKMHVIQMHRISEILFENYLYGIHRCAQNLANSDCLLLTRSEVCFEF